MTRRLHVFALPQPSHRAVLDEILLDLAARLEGPRFVPHMTLFAGHFDGDAGLLALVRQLADSTSAFELPVEGVGSGTKIRKCVFVRLETSPVATGLCERVRELTTSEDFEFDPHVSLLYKDLPPLVAADVAAEVRLPLARLRFTELLVNERTGSPGPTDPSSWHTLLRLPLSSRVGSGR